MPARDPRLPPELPSINPYAAPTAVVADVTPGVSEAEAIRTAHIRHERQLKGIGSLSLLVGFLGMLGGIAMVVGAFGAGVGASRGTDDFALGVGAAYISIAALTGFLGLGFRRLRPWIRIPGGILSGIGLLAIPIGTLLNLYILYSMFGAKGQVVLSPSYDAIVAQTPHVKYRYTVGDKIATTIIIALVVGLLALIYLGVRGN